MQIIRQASLLLGFALTTARGQIRAPRVATPVEPIAALLNAFSDHQIVAIADDHGNEQIHAFRLALLREPRFVNVVNDLVVEFGNARYQEIIDRFVRGDDVSRDTLRQVWENTTQPEFEWDLPIYEEFFRAVRATNASLPPSKRYRVLLGDPPIDWARVTTRSQLDAWVTQRDRHAAEIIRREVLSRGRRAIVIYGAAHLARSKIVDERDADKKSLIAQLERPGAIHVFTIKPETHLDLRSRYANAASWPVPALVMLRGTDLGRLSAAADAREIAAPMEDEFDALLYLGPLTSMTKAHLDRGLCIDRAYLDMRFGRLSLLGVTPAASRLKEYCANANDGGIADLAPHLTETIRAVIRDAAIGVVDSTRIAPEARDRVVPLLRNIGTRFLKAFGPLDSLVLLSESNEGGKRIRRYRAVFSHGQGKSLWTVVFSSSDLIDSIDPRPE